MRFDYQLDVCQFGFYFSYCVIGHFQIGLGPLMISWKWRTKP